MTTLATPGTKPAPHSLQLVKGRHEGVDSGGRPLKQPPKFKRVPPEKPAELVGHASDMWDEIVGALEGLDILKSVDGPALRIACETFAMWVEARDKRLIHGITCKGSMGNDVVAPWVRVETTAAKEFRAWCAEFGLTPSAEMRLAKANEESDGEDNPFA